MLLCVLRFAMGMVYDSQEKHELAAMQYRKAFSINRQSALVCCQLGLVSVCVGVLGYWSIGGLF